MKRIGSWLVAAMVCLLCTGCSLDVESFLQPPRAQGEQQQVQQALETYIRDSGAAERYTLKYPNEGAYTSAFVLCDADGKPVQNSTATARMALAFYALASAPEDTHVNLLRRDGEEWVSIADVGSGGADIRQVTFGDLDGDGTEELLAGWSTYNSQDRRLTVYSLKNSLHVMAAGRLYNSLYVGDMTASGTDSVLLFRTAGDERVTASLERVQNGELITEDTVSLDGKIQQFGGMTLCRLAQGVHGLYVDCVREDSSLVTELICYDAEGLRAPFYDRTTNATDVTHRDNGLPARDVDGDGRLEIPYSNLLTDMSGMDLTEYITRWRSWDYATATWKDRLNTVVNTADNYLVVLDDARLEGLRTAYNPVTHTLDLMDTSRRVWLRLCAAEAGEPPVEEAEMVVLYQDDTRSCVAWFDPLLLDTEKVRYMVIRLTEGG